MVSKFSMILSQNKGHCLGINKNSQERNCEEAAQQGQTTSILKVHSSHTNTGYRQIHNGSHFTSYLRPLSTAPWEKIEFKRFQQTN